LRHRPDGGIAVLLSIVPCVLLKGTEFQRVRTYAGTARDCSDVVSSAMDAMRHAR